MLEEMPSIGGSEVGMEDRRVVGRLVEVPHRLLVGSWEEHSSRCS